MDILMYGIAVVAVGLVFYMLIKKMDIKITLFATGIVLMYLAIFMGKDIAIVDFVGSGFFVFDPLIAVVEQFKGILGRAGFIILTLGGFTSYMTYIGANNATVNLLMKPIKKIKSPYLLVPVIFLIGNLM